MGHPWADVTFTGVYWNDPERVEKLLTYVRPWFENVIVGVQTDDAREDLTFAAARRWADLVVTDKVHGHCEPTIGKVLAQIRTEWSFLVSADEWPSANLLAAFQDMLDTAKDGTDGFWIRMISSIEGVAYPSEQDNHLRVFKTYLGWPATLHSRPDTRHDAFWRPEDTLAHDRSIDEMCQDYVRYMEIGRGNPDWVAHNTLMLHDACEATAQHFGWDFIKAFEWWPQVRELAFKGKDPEAGATK